MERSKAIRAAEPFVSVVIPAYNRISETLACIQSLKEMDYKNFEIIVVDDGSTDGTSDKIRGIYPDVRILQGNGNLWWSGAMNLGITDARKRGCDYILTLNQDVEVHPRFLSYLVETAQANPRSLIGGKAYYFHEPGLLWYAGGKVNWVIRGPYMRGIGEKDYGQYDELDEVDWLSGIGVLIEASAFDEIGLMDAKRFPQYAGDTDFSLRARKKGYKLLFQPRAVLWHQVGAYDFRTHSQPLTIKEVLRPFFAGPSSFKSLRINWLLYKAHCPWYLLWIAFPSRIAYLILNSLRVYFLSHFDR